jgi:23S rRNA pseudouridine955/2504/2580 synthase
LKKETEEQPMMKRMALHAFALRFNDLKDVPRYVEAPYPKDIAALIKQLEGNK